MHDSLASVPMPYNEPILDYAPDSDERDELSLALDRIASEEIEIPCVIGGERVTTGKLETVVMPHDHGHVLGKFHVAGADEMKRAIAAAADAKREWQSMRWESRAAVLLRAAELIAGKWRMPLNAATMLGQSKTCHQAEIDAACEFIDFLRFNAAFAEELYAEQPESAPGIWNAMELRPLEGFVLSITPFNFTAIAGNLCSAPAMMGNTVVWKPAETQMLAAYYTMQIFEEAGVPPGVINMVPGFGHELAPVALADKNLGGIHFTGSTTVFRSLWQESAKNIENYRSYPRLVGETGGKDFIVAHPSADDDALVTAIVRGSFEFQGQKCSAASRVYVAQSTWDRIKDKLVETTNGLTMGDVRDFRNFMGAVIKKAAFDRHAAAIAEAKASSTARVLAGGETDSSKGWFVRPTIIEVDDPSYRTMQEELFGPIVSVYVYPDNKWTDVLEIVDQTSPYALTGAVFANERLAISQAMTTLRHAAGNFYINDKPTGAVVGQQPFGGARASGTNDKAGSPFNLLRWTSARTIKETLQPATDYRYPFLG
jgi:1-pyrroline-5-carboxylate dehydrogenase